jgi:hypothetical protein
MDITVLAQCDQRLYPIAWIGFQPDDSVSVGLRDRAFIAPDFQAQNDLFNIDNRTAVRYLMPQATDKLRSVENPHFTFHPPMTLHVRETNGPRIFDGFADVAIENLLYGVDLKALGYECTTHVPTAAATHVVLTKSTTS